MKAKIVYLTMALVLVMGLAVAAVPSASVSAFTAINIYVDDDFPDTQEYHDLHMWTTIQEGINDARDGVEGVGDTVYVYAGTYEGNVVVNKEILTIHGESASLVTVNGGGSPYAIQITANDVKVRQLTIIGGSQAGIRWVDVARGYLEMCDISGSNGDGVLLDTITNQTVQCNNVHDNYRDGIRVTGSSLKDVFSNHTYFNGNAGISLINVTTKIVVAYNESDYNKYGIYVDSSSTDNDIYSNDFHDNTTADIYTEGDGNNWVPPDPPAPVPSCTEQSLPTPPTPAGDGCFIATAAYGTSTAAEIDVLRAFRDEVLLESTLGSQLVNLYYEVSPPVADFISENSLLRTIVRELVIDPMVSVATFTQGIWGK